MATISSTGIGSGIDVDSLIGKLMSLQQQPIKDITTKSSGLQTQLSVYGQVKSALSTLRDAAAKLTSPATWYSVKATSSDTTAVTVASSGTPATGSLSVEVKQLASAQSIAMASSAANTSATVGQGTLTIQLGTWATDANNNPTGFTAKSGSSAVDVTIDAGDKLTDIRDKINAANAGVTASIIQDASGARLTITSKNSGESNGFRIQAAPGPDDTGGLAQLAYDPIGQSSGMTLALRAVNARALVNGLPVSSETNALNNTIDGLNILLLKVTPPVTLSIASDTDAIRKAITDFTAAYNAINAMLRTQTKYDDSTKTAGPLQGDSTAISLVSQLRSIVGGNTTLAGTLTRMADLGLDPGKDGSLGAGGTKLDNALNSKMSDLKTFFMGVDKNDSANNGFATKLRSFVDTVLGSDGSLSSRSKGIQSQIDRNNKRINELSDRNDSMEKRLRAQYSALDSTMSKYNGLSTYLSQQLSMLNKQSGG
ncbi:flagellar filament capping protein FliD [Roseateles sp.]|uniref:flagellar filament capping protein FliD n=1 Tax=Roseateles sp. TaxID=1971397 RepID=UPI0025E1918F|nr:flagellar filament capping protein FliD [Roseateles sp.]MBV8034378.1 flagellar filament capping protein FliD [Roseateles sp.]